MRIILFLFVCTVFLVQNGGAARILALLGATAQSLQMVVRILLEELANRGHDIVSMTTNPNFYSKDSFKGTMKVIDIQNASYSLWLDTYNRTNVYSFLSGNYKMYDTHQSVLSALSDVQLEVSEMKHILKNQSEAFDLVIVQNMAPIYYAAADRFNAPLVSFACGVGNIIDYKLIGVPYQPLFYSIFLNKNILDIDFLKKLDVLVFSFWMELVRWSWLPDHNKSARKYFGSKVMTAEGWLNKAFLSLSSFHPEIHGIRPNVPALVHTGGITLMAKGKLAPELKEYLNQSSNGVIYVSFGMTMKTSSMPLDRIMMFNKAFARLPFNFIWKWDGNVFPRKSANILLLKWVSQSDLLAHPNIVAFVTHGGINSIDESVYNQVPVVVIPFAVDQFRNAKVAEHLGIGLALDYSSLTEDVLYNAIMKVTKEYSFGSNIQSLSYAIHDKPRSGLELAVWWIEYVLRHNGTEHLAAPTMDLYEYLLLDVIAFVLVAFLLPVFLMFKCIKKTFGKISRRQY